MHYGLGTGGRWCIWHHFLLEIPSWPPSCKYDVTSEMHMTSEFQDGSHDIISGRKVLPFGECTPSVCPAHMQQRSPVPDPE